MVDVYFITENGYQCDNKHEKKTIKLKLYIVFHMSWWRHQMETFSALLAICSGNSPFPVNSPHKRQWRGTLTFSLICA